MKVPPRPFFVRALPYWFALIVLLFSLETGRSVLADVTLAWNPNPDPTVAGYRLHAGTASGVYNQVIEVGNATATAVSNLAAGKTYYFVVTAYTAAALESGPSNEIAYKTPPAPTLSISASDHTVKKGESITFTVKTSKVNPTARIVVNFTVSGAAQNGVHYVLNSSGQIVIPAGASSATVTLTALMTDLTSGSEGVTLKLKKNLAYKISDIKPKASVSILNKP